MRNQSRYYQSKMANGIRVENVYSVFLQPPCMFREVIGVQITVNSMCELLASCIHRGFLFLREIGIFNLRHLDSNGPRWLIKTARLH